MLDFWLACCGVAAIEETPEGEACWTDDAEPAGE